MRIATSWCLSPNIGDSLAPWLVQRLSQRPAVWVQPGTDVEHYLVTGSILNWSSKSSVAWGPGLASWKDEVFHGADIRAARGPLSLMRARACGWKPGKHGVAVGDPALLASRLLPRPAQRLGKVGLVPHYVDMFRAAAWEKQLNHHGVVIIDPLLPPERFCECVAACDKVMTSALHGAIVADSYGVPSRLVKLGDSIGGDGMKHWDYLASVGRCSTSEPPELTDLRGGGLEQYLAAANDDGMFKAADRDRVAGMQRDLLATCPFLDKAVHL